MGRTRAALAALALVGSGLAALGCGAEDPTVGDEDDIAETRTIFGDDRVGAALKTNARGVPGSFPDFEKLLKVGRSCARTDSKEIFVVEEESSRATGATKEVTELLPRTVVTGCNTDKQNPESVRSSFNLMVALVSSTDAPGAAKNDPMVLTPVEVMALDEKTGLYNFYVFESNGAGQTGTVTRIQRQPDGAISELRKEPGKALKTSVNQDKRCFNCHVNGGPLMNEMTEPWTNWVSTHKQLPESKLAGETLSIVSEAAAPHGEHNRSSLANDLEQTMRAAIRTWVTGVATAAGSGHGPETLAGVQPGGLAGLLKSTFCETELNFASAEGTVPLELFLDPSAVSGGSYSRPPADPADLFPILLPVRSEMDKRIELFLQKSGYLSARTIAAVRAVDDVNDVFSTARCGMYADVVKGLPTAPADVDARVRNVIGARLHAKAIPPGARATYLTKLIDLKVDDTAVKAAKTVYLAESAKTFTTATATSDLVLARLKASAGASDKVFVVSERADEGKKTTDYRFVVAQATSKSNAEELFVSVLGSPADGIAQDFMEVMSFSKTKGAYVYYALGGGGKWTQKGDGTMANPGGKAGFECASCHTSGGPNFKELQLPWNNWNSFSFSMPNPPEQAASFAALFGRKSGAESLEGIIVSGDKLWAKSRVDAALAGKAPGQSLKTLLKAVMCEVGEPNLVSNKSKHTSRLDPVTPPATLNVPPSLLVNQVLSSAGEVGYSSLGGMTFSKLTGITIKGADYLAAIKANGQTLDNVPADTIFGLFAPERGFADNMITEELLRRNLLSKDTLADLLVADFTNPVFSTERCGLAATAPDAGADAEAIRLAWVKNLETSTLKGAAALKARLAKIDDFAANQASIDAFVTACAGRATADGAGFAKDLTRLASQRRREFNDQFSNLVESPDLLPADKVKDAIPHAFRLNATTCQLEKQ